MTTLQERTAQELIEQNTARSTYSQQLAPVLQALATARLADAAERIAAALEAANAQRARPFPAQTPSTVPSTPAVPWDPFNPVF